MKKIFIGQLIKEQFEKKMQRDKNFNKRVFAESILTHRSTVYHLFEKKSIDIDLLIRISEVLEYNFLKEVYLQQENGINDSNRIIVIEITSEQIQPLHSSITHGKMIAHYKIVNNECAKIDKVTVER